MASNNLTRLCCVAMFVSLVFVSGCLHGSDNAVNGVVTRIVDGDTYDIKLSDGNIVRVRLVGIDTPEIYGANSNDKWPGMDLQELLTWGIKGKNYAETELLGKDVQLVQDSLCGEFDQYGRSLYYVVLDGTNINMELVRVGLARVYHNYDCDYKQELLLLEQEAMAMQYGVWSAMYENMAQGIYLEYINYDAEGDDNTNLNDEYVMIRNNSAIDINIDGWSILDLSGNEYRFYDIYLKAHSSLVLHSGCGEDQNGALFWCSAKPVWGNKGDTSFLYDGNGALVDTYTYGGS